MLNCFRAATRSRKGFTLVELLVVIAILGILAAIVIPKLMGQNDSARVSKVKADLATMEQAAQIYAAQRSVQVSLGPAGIQDLVNAGLLVVEPVPPMQAFTVKNTDGTVSGVIPATQEYIILMKAGTETHRPIFGDHTNAYLIEDISSWN
ncbi:MAG: prepilin-type N-terminal cleavage/methylation domain-containing protein [Negativicutes bacterium]|jgi:prepilin-type N-terminal cleavage/methylation domain-containing protein